MNGSMPDASNILRAVWENGTTLLAYPNLTSPAVYFTGYMQPGAIADSPETRGLASFTTDMLMTGTKQLNFQQLHEKIESIGASLSIGTGHLATTFFGQCLREDLETLWSLLVEIVREPAFAEKHFKRVRNRHPKSGQHRNGIPSLQPRALQRAPLRPFEYWLRADCFRPANPTVGNLPRDPLRSQWFGDGSLRGN